MVKTTFVLRRIVSTSLCFLALFAGDQGLKHQQKMAIAQKYAWVYRGVYEVAEWNFSENQKLWF